MARNTLNNLEYLALQMFLHPGQSGRFYLGKLYQYRYPKWARKWGVKSSFGASYLAPSGKYFGKLWEDHAKCTVSFTSYAIGRRGCRPYASGSFTNTYLRPVRSEWHLTPTGLEYAKRAANKLKLDLNIV